MRELDLLVRTSTSATVLVFENYERYEKEIKYVLEHYQATISLNLTARTHIHQASQSIFATSGRRLPKVREYDVNYLSVSEASSLATIFARPELRGAFDFTDENNIQRILIKECHSSLRDILLHMFQSKHIRERIEIQLRGAALIPTERKYLCLLAILGVLGASQSKYDIEDAYLSSVERTICNGIGVKLSDLFRTNHDGSLSISSAMCQYLAQQVFSPQEIREYLLLICRESYRRLTLSSFSNVYKHSIQHGKIIDHFPSFSAASELVLFYDSVKNAQAVRENAYFWLQYAIARWKNSERHLAEQFLKEARRVGEAHPGFVPFQIDHYEYQMKIEAIQRGDTDDVELTLKGAFNGVIKYIDSEDTKYHPFRLASISCNLLISRIDAFTDKVKNEFAVILRNVERRVLNADKRVAYLHYAQDADRMIAAGLRALLQGSLTGFGSRRKRRRRRSPRNQ